ncbi:MAG: hypothetical protein HYT89_04785 [Candidatus Omnitrophica bacterium]|nr:hypothetical protein [Candidatus Omnitrophota bacterium]
MKKRLIFSLTVGLVAAGFLAPRAQAASYADQFTTGEEWAEKMSEREKFMSLLVPMSLFNQYGVPFRRTPPEYVKAMDKVLLYNPYLEKEDVANIFASTVYAYEPESRPGFEWMLREFQYRNPGKEIPWPHFTLRRVPRREEASAEALWE